jgi:hypothetical protein
MTPAVRVLSADELLASLARLLAPYLAPLLSKGTSTVYSQHDGQRPIGAGRAKYTRVWHVAFDAHDQGARREGRALIMDAECWSRWCSSLPSRARKPVPVEPSRADRVLRDLGCRRAS